MENIFSSNSSEIIQRKIELISNDLSNNNQIKSIENLDYYFDLDKLTEWILKNNYKRVALQFPDELLNNSIRVLSRLREKCQNDTNFFILADTSYGSCCVDVVASEHYNADSIVHFGHSCLSYVDKLPIFYVFEKFSLNLDLVENEIKILFDNKNENIEKLVVLYDVGFSYLYEQMCQRFSNNPNIFVSKIKISDSNLEETKTLFSRQLPNDLTSKNSYYSFYYIGSKESFINPFLFYFNKNKFFNFDSNKTPVTTPILFSKTNKELMKRYYLIEKAKDAKIFGILIGTMSVANYNQAIDHASSILKKINRRYYSFLIGKLNCPKLNNFMEVDMYVLVACNENSLINSKELNKPIITLYELEIAFNCARLWGDEFICDFSLLLPGREHHIPIELSDKESDVSLITGEARHLNYTAEPQKYNDSLIRRDDALSMIHYSGAGEFLTNRSWTGLEQNLGITEVTKAIDGKKGIAAGYEEENKEKITS